MHSPLNKCPYQIDVLVKPLQALRLPVWIFDAERVRFAWANPAALKLWGADSLQALLERPLEDTSAAARTRLRQHVEDLQGSTRTAEEYWTFYPNGVPQYCECVCSHFECEASSSLLLVHALHTSAKPDSDTLYRANALLHSSVMVSIYDENGESCYRNPAARAGVASPDQSIDRHFVQPAEWRDVYRRLHREQHLSTEAQVNTASGVRWHSMNIERSPDPVTGGRGYMISEVDITEQREAQQRVQELAYSDTLTGLHNRAFLLNELSSRIKAASAAETNVAILFIDLNRFKVINDSLGHHVGDALLVAISRRLQDLVDEDHLVARLGGDEFTVVVSDDDAESIATATAADIIESLELPLRVEHHELIVTPSIGISVFPDQAESVSTLLRNADLAMYTAKTRGGGYAHFRDAMNISVQERLQLENDLRKAFVNDEFTVFYQPKVDARSGQVVGMEALVRWCHPERGIVPPLEFISVAEETDTVGQITEVVLKLAMKQQRQWALQGHELSVAVNVSANEFRSGHICDVIEKTIHETGCRPDMLVLEITESMLMADNLTVMSTLEKLKSLGISLSLDDFGTGFSNLGYLHKFPLDSIKADRSFLLEKERLEVLKMIINIGHTMNLRVVVEGVETEEQLEWVTHHGGDEIQGYLFSKPMPAEEVCGYLEQHRAWSDSWKLSA